MVLATEIGSIDDSSQFGSMQHLTKNFGRKKGYSSCYSAS